MTKKIHVEWIRIIAIVMVVLNHSDLFFTFYTNTDNSITFFVSLLISSICKVNVPLFMMITGAVLIPKGESFRDILKRRVSRILMVLIVSSAIMYGLQCFAWKKCVFSITEFMEKLFTKEIQVSYWYLYEYIGILLILPFIGAIVKNIDKKLMKALIYGGSLLKVIMMVISCFTSYNFPIDLFVLKDSFFYVVLGYYLENELTDDEYLKISKVKMLLIMISSIMLTNAMVIVNEKIYGIYNERILSIMTPVMASTIYVSVRRNCLILRNVWIERVVGLLGSCCFGVYLIEHIGQKLFLDFYLWLCNITFGVPACMIYVSCILTFSFSVVLLLKRVKIIRRYI